MLDPDPKQKFLLPIQTKQPNKWGFGSVKSDPDPTKLPSQIIY